MINDKQLTDNQLNIIGNELKLAIGNKEHRHPLRDYPKAALLFHSINNLGYYFYSDTVEKVIEISGEIYSNDIIEDLKHIAESMSYLNDGLNDRVLRDYKITEEKLGE